MTWVHFKADYDFRPLPGQTIAYLAGMRCNIVQKAADEALEAGLAETIPAPRREIAAKLEANPFWKEGDDEAAQEQTPGG